MASVSVVIVTYNGTRFLGEALQSALAQSHVPLEILVVDDGSQEDVPAIVASHGPTVRYLRQENAGPGAARNLGIRLSRGEVIALLDEDDLWHPEKTARQLQLLEQHPRCGLVYSYPRLVDEDGADIVHKPPSHFPSGSIYLELLRSNRITTPSATLIRRQVLEEVGYFDEERDCVSCEDYDLWLRIARVREVHFCPGPLVSRRLRNSSLSQNLDRHLKASFYLFNKLIFQHIKEAELSDREFCQAFNFNIHQTLKRFAYRYYFGMANREKARSLMLEALQKYPYCLRDIVYFLIFSLPEGAFQRLRNLKRRIFATGMHRV